MMAKILPLVFLATFVGANPGEAPQEVPPPEPPPPAEKPVPKPPPPRVDIVVNTGKDSSKTSSESTLETYEFTVQARAMTRGVKLENATLQLYVLGESNANHRLFNLIAQESTSFDLTDTPHKMTAKLVQVKYTRSGGGMKLGGYVVVLSDAEGDPIAVKASQARFEQNLDKIRAAKVSSTASKAFRL